MTETIGVIGVGVLGKPIAARLLRQGFRSSVYDVRPRARGGAGESRGEGVRVAGRSRAAQRIHHHLVADEAQTQDVIFEADGILTTLKDEAVVIIGSTLGPAAVQALSGAIAARGGETLDAPISGGYLAAADGTLSMMIGGRQAILDRAMPVLAAIANKITRAGGVGAGQAAKLAHQLVFSLNVMALLEGLALGAAAGVEPAVLKAHFRRRHRQQRGARPVARSRPALERHARSDRPGRRAAEHAQGPAPRARARARARRDAVSRHAGFARRGRRRRDGTRRSTTLNGGIMQYELYYTAANAGRGEFVRLPLEDARAEYVDVAREPGGSEKQMRFMQDASIAHPPFAQPFLKHGDLLIAQTANILLYLGPRIGLAPAEEGERLWAHQLELTIADLLKELQNTHHPVAHGLDYEDQKPEALTYTKHFFGERVPKFFGYFEKRGPAKAAATCSAAPCPTWISRSSS